MNDEATYYLPPDGALFRLDDAPGRRYLNEIDGLGMAPLRHLTRRGVGQHGETHLATLLQPRTITLKVTEAYASRAAMFEGHLAWFAALAPGEDAGKLRKVLPDGRVFELAVRVSAAPDAGQSDRLGARVQSYTFQLVAHDPVWRATSARYAGVQGVAGTETRVPVSVPTSVGSDTLLEDLVIAYAGNWRSHPTLTLTGPLINPLITHVERAVAVQLFFSIPAGETVTLGCDPDNPSVASASGRSLWRYLSKETDLANFYLQRGTNTLRVWGANMSAATGVEVRYDERFIGL